jgi:hypothetical protein
MSLALVQSATRAGLCPAYCTREGARNRPAQGEPARARGLLSCRRMDAVFALLTLAFFGVTWAYVRGCDRL